MKKALLSLSVAAFTLVSLSPAQAWMRNGSFSGPRGMSSVTAGGSCAGGSCSRSITRTGPYGYSMSHQGGVSCGGGSCSSSSSTTGPRGYSTSHQGSFSW